jgi:predicted SnoaL-like aldol condensation-catalyzing enzyme
MLVVGMLFLCTAAYAQEPVRADPDHQAMLASTDALLAANKRLVYDFWREVFEGGHLELADKYLEESYIQHNPNVPTGRTGFVTFFSTFVKQKPIEAFVKAPLVSITAEKDLVAAESGHPYLW